MSDITYFIDTVYKRFEQLDYCTEEDQELPSREDLEDVCQVLLNVSCMKEEGRYPAFRVCFIDPESPILDVYLYSHVLLFDEPILFANRELHKLAPALNSSMSYLILDISKKPFMITGLIASYTNWEQIMTRELTTGNRMPRIPNISVVEPGKLEACFGESPIVSYSSGTCLSFRTDTFTSTVIAEELRKDSTVSEEDRLSLLYRAIWHANGYGHGGHIYVVPSLEACAGLIEIKYRLPSPFLFGHDHEKNHVFGRMREKEIAAYADMIAKFTSVDGAVVLNKNLDLLGFGAETVVDVSSRETPAMRFISHDGLVDPTRHFNDNGMRHRACYRFCNAVEGTVAIIMSQDGTVKACTRHDGSVYVYDNVALPLM